MNRDNTQGNNGMPNNQPLNSEQVVEYNSKTSLDDKLLWLL